MYKTVYSLRFGYKPIQEFHKYFNFNPFLAMSSFCIEVSPKQCRQQAWYCLDLHFIFSLACKMFIPIHIVFSFVETKPHLNHYSIIQNSGLSAVGKCLFYRKGKSTYVCKSLIVLYFHHSYFIFWSHNKSF